ncbi:hypothetical protein SUGI_0520970 [Cryptomeria japonica]|uniref:peroxidase 31 n=1 Tax=Cryptomeria japonica TaxID=3369 RepID=UPI002408E223|nr:peroxidase 31 [Cryptomeria japonica]GLJ26737.1 hypothetical protein SUGI_0520970 [Cryptomeria japonica]
MLGLVSVWKMRMSLWAGVAVASIILGLGGVDAELSVDYYGLTCPQVENIVRGEISRKQAANPATAAGLLRIFFHDCFVDGCDASVLITSTAQHKAERDADINLSLSGDGFDAVTRAKTAVEAKCPGIVSCADIMAIATRDLLTLVGGPYYDVKKGRKDSLVSDAWRVDGNIPLTTMSVDELNTLFATRGFNQTEMTALSGAHSVGFSHCKEFMARIYNDNPTEQTIDSEYAQGLQKVCPKQNTDPNMAAFNDVLSPNKFDNVFYQSLSKQLGLLASDQILYTDPRTRGVVNYYASSEGAFFDAFAAAMDKLGSLNVKTGFEGEIRRRCEAFN